MNPLRESWKNHPLYTQGKVGLLPTEFVYALRGTDVSPTTTLQDGTRVDLEALWVHLVDEGLQEPLMIRVGRNNQSYRLEAGNHRIQVLHAHGVSFVPVTIEVVDECTPHSATSHNDGNHLFPLPPGALKPNLANGFYAPDDAFVFVPKVN